MRKIGERICKHYNGRELVVKGKRECDAGVDPVQLATGGKLAGWIKKAPCFENYGYSDKCDKCEFPSQKEMDAELREFEESTANLLVVIALIPAKGNRGQVECPKCKGIVDWTRSSNGHRHAKCRTDKCIFFME